MIHILNLQLNKKGFTTVAKYQGEDTNFAIMPVSVKNLNGGWVVATTDYVSSFIKTAVNRAIVNLISSLLFLLLINVIVYLLIKHFVTKPLKYRTRYS